MVYVTPSPGSAPSSISSSTEIRRIAPRRSLVLPAPRRESKPGFIPGALLIGVYASEPGASAGEIGRASCRERGRRSEGTHALKAKTRGEKTARTKQDSRK